MSAGRALGRGNLAARSAASSRKSRAATAGARLLGSSLPSVRSGGACGRGRPHVLVRHLVHVLAPVGDRGHLLGSTRLPGTPLGRAEHLSPTKTEVSDKDAVCGYSGAVCGVLQPFRPTRRPRYTLAAGYCGLHAAVVSFRTRRAGQPVCKDGGLEVTELLLSKPLAYPAHGREISAGTPIAAIVGDERH